MNELQDKEHELIFSLDSNEDSDENGQFLKFITDNGLVDAYKHMHPESHPATYLRGQKRPDYMFITHGLIPALRETDYLPFHTGIYSDHCALWADFNPKVLFLGDISSPVDPAIRKLKTSNPMRVDNCMDSLETYFINQNILQRVL
eukprot:10898024-Ditylum_brightwellii.AAC.1